MNYSVIIKKIKYLFTENKNCTDFQNEGKYCLQTDEISKKLTCSGIIIRFKHETARHIHYQQEITALWHIKKNSHSQREHIHLQIHLVFNVWRVFQTCDLAFDLWHSISSVWLHKYQLHQLSTTRLFSLNMKTSEYDSDLCHINYPVDTRFENDLLYLHI